MVGCGCLGLQLVTSIEPREMPPCGQTFQIAPAEEALPTAFSWRRCFPTKVRGRKADIRGYNGKASYPSVYLSRNTDATLNPLLQGAQCDMRTLISNIKELVRYQFDTRGKLLRPLLVTLMSACCNQHVNGLSHLEFSTDPLADFYTDRKLAQSVSPSQHRIAMITEMIHTTSLIHDDLLDSADFRRGKEAAYRTFGHREHDISDNQIVGADYRAPLLQVKLKYFKCGVELVHWINPDGIKADDRATTSAPDGNSAAVPSCPTSTTVQVSSIPPPAEVLLHP
ncbi:unnamed protein product [Echinostoma caproni]|uniref:Geranylgeranyl pyrophosphate synthase/polyprenyl synthetase n=1 Tax=Echinostoma caproni TaxID=27848 RepID=A0A183B8V3_9TREM|nr:unnamed protein product [Echinostoma caproni]